MPYNIILQVGSFGHNIVNPITLSANTGSVTPSTASRNELLSGSVFQVHNNATEITLTNVSNFCNTIVTASIPCAGCCSPTITSITGSGSDININYTLPTSSGCFDCIATTVELSNDGTSSWYGSNTGGCASPRVLTAPTSSVYYRITQVCSGSNSTPSNVVLYFIPTTTTTTTTEAPTTTTTTEATTTTTTEATTTTTEATTSTTTEGTTTTTEGTTTTTTEETTTTTTEATTSTTTEATTTTTTAATTTTSTSTTTTTTQPPAYAYCMGYDASDCCNAIDDYVLNCNNYKY